MKHIDDWLDERSMGRAEDDEKYAVAFFHMKRLNAVKAQIMRPIMKQHKLFCEWKGVKYRVTGCSRLGDVWLSTNFERDTGYTNRVDVDECSKWSET